ncbi:putative effector [Maize bushy stunt phytoplasma]|nr:hypothetical protein [Maize bushy stunt phytoplasma]AOF54716.1 putative effector [Maize bushy stunt phytoplasma]
MIRKIPRKKLIKLLVILTSIAFLSYLIYDFNPQVFNNRPYLDYTQVSKKIENKDYNREIRLFQHETFLRS